MARPNEESEVIGHYLVPAHGRPAQPLLHESTVLFQDVVSDKLSMVEAAVEADAGKLNQLFLILHWASDLKGGTGSGVDTVPDASDVNGAAAKTSVTVKQRTLLMIAAHAGSLRVLAYLLARGAEPSRKSPDGVTAYDMAVAGEASQAATALAMMRDADSRPSSSTRSSSTTETQSFNGGGANRQDLVDSEGSSYSTTDLTRPEYSTDEFRMFNFKVLRCSKRHAHDWRACPFAHPTENARRRDPREFKYCALACPDYKQGFCIRGDLCPYAHGVFECWLHPSRYRTQLCKDGANCHRPVCFFAHSLPELRAPTYTWVPTPADLSKVPLVSQNNGTATNNTNTNNNGASTPATSAISSNGSGLNGSNSSVAAALALGAGDLSSGGGVGGGRGGGGGFQQPGAAGGSPLAAAAAAVGATERVLLSTASSGIPPTSTSSDGTSSGMGGACGSPRGAANGHLNCSGSGMLSGLALLGGSATSLSVSAGGMGLGLAPGSCNGHGNSLGFAGSSSSSSSSSGVNGSSSPSCSVGSKDGCGGGGMQAVANGKEAKSCHSGANGVASGVASAPGSGGKGNQNLTQPNAAASVLGFTAPRMSNAFARRHGLNPKDNPMLNLQKIALQSQQQQLQSQQQLLQQQQQQQQMGSLGVTGGHLGAFTQDGNATAAALRNQAAVAAAAASGNGAAVLQGVGATGGRGAGGGCAGFNGNTNGQQRLAAAAAAAAAANGGAASPGALSVPFGAPTAASAFGVGPMQQMQMHAAAAAAAAAAGHLGGAPGSPADSSLLAAHIAALNIHQQHQVQVQQQRQQQQQHHLGGIGIGIGNISHMASGAAAGMGAAAGIGHMSAMPYISASANPHHALMHAGMYGAGPGGGMYDTAQHHLMVAMSGTQTEV